MERNAKANRWQKNELVVEWFICRYTYTNFYRSDELWLSKKTRV